MHPYARPLAILTGLLALFVLLGAGCDKPAVGKHCTPGSYYTHVDNKGRRTSLSCNSDGIWRRAE